MKISEKINNKRILIWGYGREGKATESFINEYCQPLQVTIFEGSQEDIDENLYDMIIKSPGIVPRWINEKYTSQTELFLEEFSSQVIGITGTKGKSTTTNLLYEALKAGQKKKVLLMGNMGLPCFNYYGEIDSDTIITFEMSCHQLEFLKVSPHIAVFLNLYEDHLDHYGTFEKYFEAKKQITLHQNENDYLFIGEQVPFFESKAQRRIVSYDDPKHFDMNLKGEHNQYNARFVYYICMELFKCDEAKVLEAIKNFNGLTHRMEFVGNIGGVDYYNDSISTIPEATIRAINSIPNAKTVLIGGMDRQIHYGILIDFIKTHEQYNYILSYDSGKRIFDSVKDLSCCYYVKDLKESVELAKKITPEGSACILSPAAASYGYFTNFEERGDAFKQLVHGEKTTLIFTGDIGFDKYMDGKWEDENLISDEILDYLHDAAHVIANVEGPLLRREKNPNATGIEALIHTMDPEVTNVLQKMNADIWNINNNHIMDAGEEGVRGTLEEARKCGVRTVGAGMDIEEAAKPLYLNEAGGIGIFAVGYRRACRAADVNKPGCLSWENMEVIQRNIDDIKAKCRWCIIISHGGEEFTALPSPYVRDRYLKYLEMGADIVVCHHPHVPMNYEVFPGKAIFYSLGNFIFDTDYQRSQFNTEKGILLKLELTPDEFSFEGFGIKINRVSEHIEKGDLPIIFQNVPEEEYEKLAPLAAKMFVAATKRQQIYMNPDKFKNATEEEWEAHFAEEKRSGRVPGEALDFFIVCPLAKKAEEGEWKKSNLEEVKKYILEQM